MAESPTGKCIADVIADVLRYHGVDRVFGLCGGHIMPLWMAAHAAGIWDQAERAWRERAARVSLEG